MGGRHGLQYRGIKMQIKICGLTDVAEAEYLNRNRVDYAGFVLFYEKSRRNITIEQAKPIMEALLPTIKKVAVVVSPTMEQACRIREAGFDYIQVHGQLEADLANVMPVWKAFNISDMDRLAEYAQNPNIKGYVFDAAEPGSGKAFEWNLLKGIPRDGKNFLLAGGLRPGNVAQAVKEVRPDGVDVSSGVEYTDRRGKDPAKVDAFVRAAREADSAE